MPLPSYEQRLTDAKESTDKAGAEKDLRKLERELKEKAKVPTNGEIQEVNKGGTSETKLELGKSILARAFESTDNQGMDLTRATEIPANGRIDWKSGKAEGEPQIFYRQITKTVEQRGNIFQGFKKTEKQVLTDEVLVVVVLQNGEKPTENTVVTAVMKQEKGVLKMDEQHGFMTAVTTEAEYKKISKPENQSCTARYSRGELTMEEFNKEYKKENKRSPEDYWKNWDAQVKNKSDYWRSEKCKADVIDRLGDRYVSLLETAKETRKQIHTEIEQALDALEKERTNMLRNPRFKALADQVRYMKGRGRHGDVETHIDILRTVFPNISDKDIADLLR